MLLALYLLRGSKSIDPASLTLLLHHPVIIIILLLGIVILSYILCVIGVKNENGEICYVIGVLKSIRKKLGKMDGDTIHVVIAER